MTGKKGYVHEMQLDNQNNSVHAVATSLVFDRDSSSHLEDEEPQQSLAGTDMVNLVELEEIELVEQFSAYKKIAA